MYRYLKANRKGAVSAAIAVGAVVSVIISGSSLMAGLTALENPFGGEETANEVNVRSQLGADIETVCDDNAINNIPARELELSSQSSSSDPVVNICNPAAGEESDEYNALCLNEKPVAYPECQVEFACGGDGFDGGAYEVQKQGEETSEVLVRCLD